MRPFHLPFLLVISLSILSNGLAQQIVPKSVEQPQRIRFEHLTMADGLPENSVTRILQDHLGFMWLGTQNGLVRYDGTTMTTFQYDPRKPFSLKGRIVAALHEDRNGDIWVGCESLFRYERATGRFIEYPRKGPEKTDQKEFIMSIHQDRQGNLWTITPRDNFQTFVLDRLNPRTSSWTYFRHNPKDNHSLASSSVYQRTGNTFSNYSFGEDPTGKLWVVTQGSTGNTLHWFDQSADRFTRFVPPTALASDFKHIGVLSIVKQHLYLSSNHQGLFRLTPKTGQIERFVHQTTNPNSLRCDTVGQVYQDRLGIVWISTYNGMDQLNPRTGTFTHLATDPDEPTIPRNGRLTICLHEMPNGDLWFAATKGLRFYHRQSGQFIRYEDEPADHEGSLQGEGISSFISSFLVDKTGLVWAGSFGMGLNKQSRSIKFPLLAHKTDKANSLQSNQILTIYEAPSEPGVIWFGTDKGLDRWDKKTDQYTHFQYDSLNRHSIGKGEISALVEDKKGRFWIGTPKNGLYLMNRKTGQFTRFVPDLKTHPNESRFQEVGNLLAAKDGTLWLSTGTGLNHLDVDRNRYNYYFKTDDAYTPELFTQLMPLRSPQRQLAAILHPQGKVDQTVSFQVAEPTAVCIVIGGVLPTAAIKWDYGWLEDAQGRIIWEMSFENSKSDSYHYQRIEIKTLKLPAGQYRLRYKSDDRFYYGSWPSNPPIHADLWGIQLLRITSAESQQLSRLIGQPYRRTGLSDSDIFALQEDAKGHIWVGTNLGGVNQVDPTTGTISVYYNYINGPYSIATLLADPQSGGWWLSDYLNGLLFLDRQGKVTKRYTVADGLPGSILSIQRDEQGTLWLGSANGLCRFNPKTGRARTYTLRNGLPDLSSYVSFKASDGGLYFGGRKGVNVFYSRQVQEDTIAPPVVLTDLAINGQPATLGPAGQLPTHITLAKEISLPYDQNDLTFHFAALSYNKGNESQYAFKLSPKDTSWVSIGTTRQAHLLDLRPGTYTFWVKAANADEVWNEKGTSIQITIRPPWWQTWWAYLLYALAVGGALRAYILYRSRALRRENQVLEEKVAQRTNEVQQQKEEIESQRDYLEETLTELKSTQDQLIQKEKLASLGELTAGIAHEIQNPLNFVNNFSEVSSELVSELREEEAKPDRDEELIADLFNDLSSNLQKINHHGGRASSIVKGMLEHSRISSGDKQPTNLNALCDEYLKIAYHGQRANNKSFNCELVTAFDPDLGKVELIPQDMGRVLLNLYNNAFYAVWERARQATEPDYQPIVRVSSKRLRDRVEIHVSDNGIGIPEVVKAKIFQPFFTTKPTGEGTGLGLSLSYDIITKGHGGTLTVESVEGEGTTFIIQLPSHT